MKILAVGMNYREHLKELGNPIPQEPVIFSKPDSSLLEATEKRPSTNMPFFLPDFNSAIHYETELVIRINRLGKSIAAKYASRYYDAVTVGLDLTARDLQQRLRSEGKPWDLCKGFDQSAVVGSFVPVETLGSIQQLHFSLLRNGNTVQQGHAADMIFTIDTIIEYVSRFFTLKTGDLIYTGTPSGIGALAVGDHLEGFLEDRKCLDLRVK
jgi:fumarylpyruvate hydrolase